MTVTRHRPDQPAEDYLPGLGHPALTPLYDVVQRLFGVPRVHRLVVDLADLRPGARVLEIGCGTGNLALLAARRRPDAAVVGLDPDPAALAVGRRKAARQGVRSGGVAVRFDEGRAERLPYPDASFDVVLSALMLHHLSPDGRVAALAEVRRVLADGGVLVLADLGGAPARGLAARMGAHRVVDDVPALLRDAGLGSASAAVTTDSRRTGPITAYRATG